MEHLKCDIGKRKKTQTTHNPYLWTQIFKVMHRCAVTFDPVPAERRPLLNPVVVQLEGFDLTPLAAQCRELLPVETTDAISLRPALICIDSARRGRGKKNSAAQRFCLGLGQPDLTGAS